MKNILLVFSEQERDVARLISDHVEANCDDMTCTLASTAARAIVLLDKQAYDHVVVGVGLATDPGSPVELDGGLTLCRRIRAWSEVDLMLVLPGSNNDIEVTCASMSPRTLVLHSSEALAESVVRVVRQVAAPARRLDVVICAKQGTTWRYRLTGVNFRYERDGDLNLGKSRVAACLSLSEGLEESRRAKDWFKAFSRLGSCLILTLCESNEQFLAQLKAGIEQVGDFSRTRILFEVDRDHMQVTLEAIFLPDEAQPLEPWMLWAPLLRNVPLKESLAEPLFEGRRHRLRALILCADTSGQVADAFNPDGSPIQLGVLRHVAREVQTVQRLLENPPDTIAVVPPLVLGADPGAPLDKKTLIEALRNSEWDIVHFAGHSYFKYVKDQQELAYLFVGPPDKPQAVSLTELAGYLRRARLLFLSSCESGNASFIAGAARAGVPAVIGFRWPVQDIRAARYAEKFYEMLLSEQSVETAFLKARRDLHQEDHSDATWASATLVTSGKTQAA